MIELSTHSEQNNNIHLLMELNAQLARLLTDRNDVFMTKERDMKHLRQRVKGGVYQIQFKVPDRLLHLSEGKKVVTRSTSTSNYKEAIVHRNAFLREWELLKRKSGINPEGKRLRALVAQLKKSFIDAQANKHDTQEWHDAHDPEYFHEQGDELMTDAILIAQGKEGKFSGVSMVPTLPEVLEDLRADLEEQGTKSKSYYNKISRVGERWNEYCNENLPINEIGRIKVKGFIKYLQKTLKSKTINDTLSVCNQGWKFAANNEEREVEIGSSPFTEHQFKKDKTDSYISFEFEEFKSTINNYLSKCKTTGARLFPFLGLTSSMRIEELGALRKKDIVKINGVYCFSVQEEDDRSLKTANATRYIPIVKRYLRYVKELAKGDPNDFLFEEAKTRPSERSGWFGEAFGDAKRASGINNRYKSFHSLRGMFATACENAGLDEKVASRLSGHKFSESLTFGLYSDGPSVKNILKPAMDKVEKELIQYLKLDSLES